MSKYSIHNYCPICNGVLNRLFCGKRVNFKKNYVSTPYAYCFYCNKLFETLMAEIKPDKAKIKQSLEDKK